MRWVLGLVLAVLAGVVWDDAEAVELPPGLEVACTSGDRPAGSDPFFPPSACPGVASSQTVFEAQWVQCTGGAGYVQMAAGQGGWSSWLYGWPDVGEACGDWWWGFPVPDGEVVSMRWDLLVAAAAEPPASAASAASGAGVSQASFDGFAAVALAGMGIAVFFGAYSVGRRS